MERKGISMNKKSTHPFAPEIPEGATKLIIGTMPPYRFCNTDEMLYDDDVNFYYGSRDNYFWELVSDASGKRLTYANTQEAINERKRLLADLHMGMVDMVVSCVHKDGKADDKSLHDIVERDDLKTILHKYPKIDTLIYTNEESTNHSGSGSTNHQTSSIMRDGIKAKPMLQLSSTKKHIKSFGSIPHLPMR